MEKYSFETGERRDIKDIFLELLDATMHYDHVLYTIYKVKSGEIDQCPHAKKAFIKKYHGYSGKKANYSQASFINAYRHLEYAAESCYARCRKMALELNAQYAKGDKIENVGMLINYLARKEGQYGQITLKYDDSYRVISPIRREYEKNFLEAYDRGIILSMKDLRNIHYFTVLKNNIQKEINKIKKLP